MPIYGTDLNFGTHSIDGTKLSVENRIKFPMIRKDIYYVSFYL